MSLCLFSIVQFYSHDDVLECCEAQLSLKGRILKCNAIRDVPSFFRKVKEDIGVNFLNGTITREAPASQRQTALSNLSYELYGLSIDFLRAHSIEPPLCSRVFVANVS